MAMAMHTGLGLSKILLFVGAGYAGSILMKNGHLETLLKWFEEGNASDSDEVRRILTEIRRQIPDRQVIVLNGDSSQAGSVASLAMPAAALGALGYGYMWWKGFSFADLMYVTKHNMANAVSSMTKNLEQVSSVLAATKKHLTQRIENLDGKLDEQKEISKLIKNEVTDVCTDLSQIGYDLETLQKLVCGLDGKINALEDKQDFANAGVWYLCQFVDAKDGKNSELLKGLPKPTNRRGFLENVETRSLKGLQQIADVIGAGTIDKLKNDPTTQNDVSMDKKRPLCISRTASIKCS